MHDYPPLLYYRWETFIGPKLVDFNMRNKSSSETEAEFAMYTNSHDSVWDVNLSLEKGILRITGMADTMFEDEYFEITYDLYS